MKRMKRTISIFLSMLMLFALLPTAALADLVVAPVKTFMVGFDAALGGTVKMKIGDDAEQDVTDPWSRSYSYDGATQITFTLTPSEEAAEEDIEPAVEVWYHLADENDQEKEAVQPQLTKNQNDGTYSFTITPNSLWTDVTDPQFTVYVSWNPEYEQFGPNDDQYMVEIYVPGGDDEGWVRVQPGPNDGNYMSFGCKEKCIYDKKDEEDKLYVTFYPNPGMKIHGLVIGDDYYGFVDDQIRDDLTDVTFQDLPTLQPDGSCRMTITIPAASAPTPLSGDDDPDDAAPENAIYVEAQFVGAGEGNVPAVPSNLRWDGKVAKWDAVPGADNYGVKLKYTAPEYIGSDYWLTASPDPNFTDGACSCDFSAYLDSLIDSGAVWGFSVFSTKNNVRSDDSDPCAYGGSTTTGYTVTFNATGGSVTPATGTTGADGKLSTLPTPTRSDYSFKGWYTAASGGTQVTTDTVFTQNTTIYAQWNYTGGSGPVTPSVTYYTLTATAGEGGSISPSGQVGVRRNGAKTFTITPDEGYVVDDVLVDGESVGAVTEYTFEKVTKKHTIAVSFQEAEVRPAWNPFEDITVGAWFYDSVKYVCENGMMVGTAEDKFSPDATTTRGMIVTILYRLEGEPDVSGTNVFNDVAEGKYYADAVKWAAKNEIVSGYGNGKFGPEDAITREQMAAILYRYASYKGEDMTKTADLSKFTDSGKISGYAEAPLSWVNAEGLISGKGGGILDPLGKATRAEVSAILHRFCENVVK